jgi:hypothetical protein
LGKSNERDHSTNSQYLSHGSWIARLDRKYIRPSIVKEFHCLIVEEFHFFFRGCATAGFNGHQQANNFLQAGTQFCWERGADEPNCHLIRMESIGEGARQAFRM